MILVPSASGPDDSSFNVRGSLADWWLPKFNFFALWIYDPGKFSVFAFVNLVENVTRTYAS